MCIVIFEFLYCKILLLILVRYWRNAQGKIVASTKQSRNVQVGNVIPRANNSAVAYKLNQVALLLSSL